jgi:hypothetical protein
MINDACLKTINWRGKENMHPASLTRRTIFLDELLFLLLWSSGHIKPKIGLSLSATFSLLFFAKFSSTPLVIFLDAAFGSNMQCGAGIIFAIFFTASYDADCMASFVEAHSLVGFVGVFITAGGFLLIHLHRQGLAHRAG